MSWVTVHELWGRRNGSAIDSLLASSGHHLIVARRAAIRADRRDRVCQIIEHIPQAHHGEQRCWMAVDGGDDALVLGVGAHDGISQGFSG